MPFQPSNSNIENVAIRLRAGLPFGIPIDVSEALRRIIDLRITLAFYVEDGRGRGRWQKVAPKHLRRYAYGGFWLTFKFGDYPFEREYRWDQLFISVEDEKRMFPRKSFSQPRPPVTNADLTNATSDLPAASLAHDPSIASLGTQDAVVKAARYFLKGLRSDQVAGYLWGKRWHLNKLAKALHAHADDDDYAKYDLARSSLRTLEKILGKNRDKLPQIRR